jgi:hypothetical protein
LNAPKEEDMFTNRINRHSALTILALLLAACAPVAVPPTSLPPTTVPSSPTPVPSPMKFVMSTEPDAVWQLVVIGDFSVEGLGEAYASQVNKDVGVQVNLVEFISPILGADELLEVLQTGKSSNFLLEKLPEALKQADVVIMSTNPLDSSDPASTLQIEGCTTGCSEPENCAPEAFAQYQADLQAIWGEIFRLRAGQPTILRATDLYNPVLARWDECGNASACQVCWENMSAAARQAAAAYGIPFLSRYDAFNGPDHSEDPRQKGYIQEDGEHPSELAARYTAGLLAELGYAPVPPPE